MAPGMLQMRCSSLLSFILFISLHIKCIHGEDTDTPTATDSSFLPIRPFIEPEVWDANQFSNNTIELDLDWLEVDPGYGGIPYETRVLGGSFPGPTIIVSPGTVLKVHFRNKLRKQSSSKQHHSGYINQFSDPDTGNLHFHGTHVTAILPGDDPTLSVRPGESYNYTIPILPDHAPGLHWIHTHHHGSTSIQVGGGAACAFIVKDPPGSLPSQIAEAKEVVMVFQDNDLVKLSQEAKEARDDRYAASLNHAMNSRTDGGGGKVKKRFVTINGVHRPTMTMTRGKWQRWRILYAGWRTSALHFHTNHNLNHADCEFQLLAKDGIYIDDYPRKVDNLPIPPGGRADVMVRCNKVGNTVFKSIRGKILTVAVTVVVEEDEESIDSASTNETQANTNNLIPWYTKEIPKYLHDLRNSTVSPGCSCNIDFSGRKNHLVINGHQYTPGNHFLHSSYLGAVVERHITFQSKHSYHQHVYPFQLITDDFSSNYFQVGDWHDTYMDGKNEAIIRYSPTNFPGKIILHCHNNIHSDHGMLAKEYVRNVTDGEGECQCDINGPIEGEGLVDVDDDDDGIFMLSLSHPHQSDGLGGEGYGMDNMTAVAYMILFVALCMIVKAAVANHEWLGGGDRKREKRVNVNIDIADPSECDFMVSFHGEKGGRDEEGSAVRLNKEDGYRTFLNGANAPAEGS